MTPTTQTEPPAFTRARAPWIYAPALLFAATPAVAWLGNLYRFEQYDGLSYWDWASLSFTGAITLILAAFTAILAEKFHHSGVAILCMSAVSAAWVSFLTPAQSGGGAALIELGGAAIWLFCALSLWAYGWSRLTWLLWITLPVLAIASAACLWWLGHELIYVYGPALF